LPVTKLFQNQLFTDTCDDSDLATGWFLAIAALTGARTEEIALAPAQLVLLGDSTAWISARRASGRAPRPGCF
jgi:hypothetical protein